MLTLLIIFANSALAVVYADLVVKPRDTEAVIGVSTYFDCTSNVNRNQVNWYHYAVGAQDHEDTCLYCLGRVHPEYKNKIQVEKNLSTGSFQLRIKSVQKQDAGRYICQDNGGIGESASAQLVILESSPTCTSNMKPDGVLGPNNCGLEPDTLHLSCHVLYHGNIPPVLKWRKARTEDPVNPLSCQNIGNLMTCNLTMKGELRLNGVSYICETNRSTTTQYNCGSDIIRVIYANNNNSTQETTEGAEEKVYCSVNSSLSCSHTWKWFDGVHEEVVAYDSALVAHKLGWHKCEAECNIRGKRCTVLSKLVHVSEPKRLSTGAAIAVSFIVIIFVEFVIIVLICSRLRNRNKRRPIDEEKQSDSDSERSLLLQSENLDRSGRPIYEKQQSVTTTAAKEQRRLIRGMAILDNELFVVTQKCSEVEVFDSNTLVVNRQWTVKELSHPSDIASCKVNGCLYIMNWKGDSLRKEVLRVDPNGKLVHSWQTGDDCGDLISVTYKKNIIVTCHGKNELNEYSPEGIMIRKRSLQGAEVPTHAIKLTNDDFIVSNGDSSHLLHGVCIIDANGTVKKSFGGEKGSDLEHLDHPMHLAVFADGSVAVLDNGNRRVLLLDKDLQFDRVLLSHKTHRLQTPNRLLLDESSGRLLVADSHSGMGDILFFRLNKICEM